MAIGKQQRVRLPVAPSGATATGPSSAPGAPESALGEFSDAALTRPDVRFINRQRGSGTRLLLETMLEEQGLEPGGQVARMRAPPVSREPIACVMPGCVGRA